MNVKPINQTDMKQTNEKEQRSEYVSIYVTPTVAKEFKAAKENEALKESIIRGFIEREVDFLKDEMKEIDEATIRYTAKLLTIKDKFTEAQDKYSEEIAELCNISYKAFEPIETKFNSFKKQIENTQKEVTVPNQSRRTVFTRVRVYAFPFDVLREGNTINIWLNTARKTVMTRDEEHEFITPIATLPPTDLAALCRMAEIAPEELNKFLGKLNYGK